MKLRKTTPLEATAPRSTTKPDDGDPEAPESTLNAERTSPGKRHLPIWFFGGAVIGFVLVVLAAVDEDNKGNWFAFVVIIALTAAATIFLCETAAAVIRREGNWDGWLAYCLAFGGTLAVSMYFVHTKVWDLHLQDVSRRTYVVTNVVAVGVAILVCVLSWKRADSRNKMARQTASCVTGFVVTVVFLVGLIACSAASRQQAHEVSDSHPQITTIESGTYVALGDSYSSGEGLTPFLPGAEPGCHRSPYAYPLLLTFSANVPGERPAVSTEFRACAGAVTSDIDYGVVGGSAPQIHTNKAASLVTITVGGNDVTFANVVAQCFLYEDCIQEPYSTNKEIDPARPFVDYPPFDTDRTFKQWAETMIADYLVEDLHRVYGDLKSAYPNARIVVIGYPYLFPEGNAPGLSNLDCFVVLNRVSVRERAELRDLGRLLNDTLYTTAYANGLEFVSPEAVWDGHEPCGAKDPFTNAIVPVLKMKPLSSGTFHPNRQGQQALAELVACYVNNFPQPDAREDGSFTLDPSGAPGSLGSPLCAPKN